MQSVLILNADMSVLCFVDMPRAVTLLMSVEDSRSCPKCQAKPGTRCINLETKTRMREIHDERRIPQATMFEADPDRMVRSPSMEIEWPRIISLTRYVYVPFAARTRGDVSDFATKKDILDRDRRTCAFCGKKGETVDHVLPKSRGGRDTWENLVAACSKCNNNKGDRTPEEWCSQSSMHTNVACKHKLLWQPYRPDAVGAEQRAVWDALST